MSTDNSFPIFVFTRKEYLRAVQFIAETETEFKTECLMCELVSAMFPRCINAIDVKQDVNNWRKGYRP